MTRHLTPLAPAPTRPPTRRSKVFNFWSWGAPHQQAFQLSWISFIIAFFATFAAPPLLPVIRNNLDLTKADLSAAAVASVIGAAFSRILAGVVCDSLGPRAAHASLQLLTSTATFCMVRSAASFLDRPIEAETNETTNQPTNHPPLTTRSNQPTN